MQLSYIHRRIVVTIRTHSEPQYCFIKLWADVVCLSITQNDDVIDMLLKENEKQRRKKETIQRKENICSPPRGVYARNNLFDIFISLNTKYIASHKNSTRASAWRSYFFPFRRFFFAKFTRIRYPLNQPRCRVRTYTYQSRRG